MSDRPMSTFTCGCGFTCSGFDEELSCQTFESHECADMPVRWHQSVFSFWGVFFMLAVGWSVFKVLEVLR